MNKVRSVMPGIIQVSPKVAVVLVVVILTTCGIGAFYDFEQQETRSLLLVINAFVSGVFIWPMLPIWLVLIDLKK